VKLSDGIVKIGVRQASDEAGDIPAEDIWKIEPEMTVIGGEVVFLRKH